MSKKLTSLEFERMEHYRLLKELRAKELAILNLQVDRIADKQRILELMIKNLDIERHSIVSDKEKVNKRAGKERDEYEVILSKIRKRARLTGKFGYNPDTLEIVQE